MTQKQLEEIKDFGKLVNGNIGIERFNMLINEIEFLNLKSIEIKPKNNLFDIV